MSRSDNRIRIVADENIALPSHLSQHLEITTLPGREILPHHVADADALLVRSVTRVNHALLSGSRVRFVGTATSGTDHLDLDWLAEAGIEVVDAAGANAGAVTDYVLSCLASLLQDTRLQWSTLRVAVVGVGRVGSQLAGRLQALGVECVGCDPFQQLVAGLRYVSLDEALRADVVCLHTPLTTGGSHPTRHMLDAKRLATLARQTILINAGRGEVVDNQALKRHAQQFPERKFILDVWENEPRPDPELVSRAYIATPHIAGYSLESKQLAGQQVLHALCRHFNIADEGVLSEGGTRDAAPTGVALEAPMALEVEPDALLTNILQCFSSKALSVRFQKDYLAAASSPQAAEVFDQYRREQLSRREFSARPVPVAAPDSAIGRALQAAGFVVAVSDTADQ